MSTEKRVFAILKKITKEQKTELSAVSDLQDWLDVNTITANEYARIQDFESALSDITNSLDDFLRNKEAFEQTYGDLENFKVGDFEDQRLEGNYFLDNYDVLAQELGIEPDQNEAYKEVSAQIAEFYPEFIGKLSDAYYGADLLIEEAQSNGITIN